MYIFVFPAYIFSWLRTLALDYFPIFNRKYYFLFLTIKPQVSYKENL